MATNFKTRFFEDKDLTEVKQINLTCLPENYSDSFFMNIYKKFPKTFLVATVDDKVVGYVMCRVELGFSELKRLKIGKKGHLVSLAVLSEYRKQGVASVLLSKALENLSEYKVGECYLEVRVTNESALDLYKILDFKTLRVLSGYYKDGEAAYLMSKTLV